MQSSLGALEGKLRELQQALAGLSGAEKPPAPPSRSISSPEPPGPVVPSPTAPAEPDPVAEAEAEAVRIVEDARARASVLSAQIDELVDLRDGLYASARGLLDEWEGALARARGEDAPLVEEPPVLFSGTVAVTAGPFAALDELGDLERGLEAIAGVDRVAFRGFRRDWVTVDVVLAEPAALVEELHRSLPFALAGVDGGGDALTVTLARSDPA